MATCKRVMVTPAVCPRLCEIPTTLTVGAQRRNHIVSTAYETVARKKKEGRLVVHVRSAIHHELSRTQPKSEENCVSVGDDSLAVTW